MKNCDVFERGSSSQIKVSVCAVFTTGSITVAGANQMTENSDGGLRQYYWLGKKAEYEAHKVRSLSFHINLCKAHFE